MEILSSVNNPKIKEYCVLVSSAKERKKQGLFVLEGLRLVEDVLRSGRSIKELYFTKENYDKNTEKLEELIAVSERVFEISDAVSVKMSDTKNPQGVFCVINALDKRNDGNKINAKDGRYILLENIQDPANLGAVSRTAEALGIDGLIVFGGCDIYSPKALRASMGALLRVQIMLTDDVIKTIHDLQALGMKVYASTPKAEALSITKADFSNGAVCVIGNEANGVSKEVQSCCDERITIKMTGRAESLNAGAAASIIMWEMVMSRNDKQ